MSFRVPINDLSRHSPGEAASVADQIMEIVASGQYFNAKATHHLRSQMAEMFDGHDFIPLANGTDALILALEALHLDQGSLVAMAPNAGGYACIAALRAGLRPLFVDIDLTSAQMSIDALKEQLSRGPKVSAVIVTHLYGQVGEIEKIHKVCTDHGTLLIEDCAQSLGARIDGRPAGTFGAISTFSFYPTKNLGAAGDAGGILTRDQSLSAEIRRLAQYGWGERYDIQQPRGFNSRMDEIQAAVICHKFQHLEQWNVSRRAIVRRYSEALPVGCRMIGDYMSSAFVAHLAVMVAPERDVVRNHLTQAGIETSIHYPHLDPDQTAWQQMFSDTEIPSARQLNQSILTLPCFPTMTEEEIEAVCSSLSQIGE